MGLTIYPPQGGAGTGDVVGPVVATDNAVVRWNGTTGELVQNSAAFVDDNGNVYAPNIAAGYATTATAAGTTTLTVASKGIQVFTGATTQTVTLPVVSTLPQTGFGYWIINNSSGAVTVNSSGANAVQVMAAGARMLVVANALSGTSAAVWDKMYVLAGSGDVTASGTLTTNAVMLGGGTTVVQAVAGITTDGVSILNLGEGGTSNGSIKFYNDDLSANYLQLSPPAGDLNTRVLTLPLVSNSDTLVAVAAAQTLTNKTIDCDSNTVTNVARLKVDADNTLPATCAKGEVVVLDNGTFWSGQATNDWQQVLTASDIGGVRAVTGTTDTILSTDFSKLVTFTNAATIAVTLPQAGSGSPSAWNNGWWFTAENIGSTAVTITPTTSTINGIATLVLLAGQSAIIFSNGTNYLASVAVSSKSVYNAALNVDDTYTGSAIVGLNAGATIAQWEPVYIGGSSTWLLADANGSGTYPARGLATAAYVDTNPAVIMTQGTVRNDAWNWTIGGTIYLSGTAGALTQTAPSTSGDKVQAVGYALTADIAYFDFNSTYLTVT